MDSRWGRFARGWVAASFSVFVAAFAHLVGGGGLPTPLAVVFSLAFAAMVCIPLAGRTVSLLRLSIAVGIAQATFHILFALGGGVTVSQAAHHGPIVVTGAVEHGHEGMLPAHVLAAVVTVIALRLGEGAVRSLLELAREGLRRVVLPALAPVDVPSPAPTPVAVRRMLPTALVPLLGSVSRRGPPAAHALLVG